MPRTPYIAANWKMNKTVAEASEFIDALLPRIAATQNDVVVCPPFTALHEVVERRRGTAVRVAAQNMHFDESGAFTGEISAPMLVELDVEAVVLGHSERRQFFGETDEALAKKVPAALAADLEPILCVGESEEARDGGQTEEVLERQLQADLAEVSDEDVAKVVDRLRADLGDRDRQGRDPRAGPGSVRLHPRRPAGARRRGRRRPDPLRRLGEAGERGGAAGAAGRRRSPRRRRGSRRRRLRRDSGGRMTVPGVAKLRPRSASSGHARTGALPSSALPASLPGDAWEVSCLR